MTVSAAGALSINDPAIAPSLNPSSVASGRHLLAASGTGGKGEHAEKSGGRPRAALRGLAERLLYSPSRRRGSAWVSDGPSTPRGEIRAGAQPQIPFPP